MTADLKFALRQLGKSPAMHSEKNVSCDKRIIHRRNGWIVPET